jgi:hypothetical protein
MIKEFKYKIMKEQIMCECQKEIESVLNKYNTCNTLDSVLAKYLENCLKSFNDVITLKEKIDNEKLIDEIEEENGGAFINSNDSESNLVTVFEIPEKEKEEEKEEDVNIFDADEEINDDSELESNNSESDDDFWN